MRARNEGVSRGQDERVIRDMIERGFLWSDRLDMMRGRERLLME